MIDPEFTTWAADHIRQGEGLFTRWRLELLGLGYVYVENHDQCVALDRRFKCPKGWELRGSPLFVDGQRLKARTLEDAKREAIGEVRKYLARTLKELGHVEENRPRQVHRRASRKS